MPDAQPEVLPFVDTEPETPPEEAPPAEYVPPVPAAATDGDTLDDQPKTGGTPIWLWAGAFWLSFDGILLLLFPLRRRKQSRK